MRRSQRGGGAVPLPRDDELFAFPRDDELFALPRDDEPSALPRDDEPSRDEERGLPDDEPIRPMISFYA